MFRKSLILVLVALFTFACATTDNTGNTTEDANKRTKRGAAIGAVAGAIAGAVIGNQSGNNRTGAVVGAAAGAAVGAVVGRRMDKQAAELRQIEGVEVEHTEGTGEINVRLTSDILFDHNSSALRATSRSTLEELATNFAQYPDNMITVEGHTDSTGTDAYNQRLSEARASNVADYLIDRGVRAGAITVYGYGELRPKSSNDTAEGRQLNRRVEINIRAPQENASR
ncbi:MAG TPA: OmpA family protein [Thermoanaerobaculia bacterium]|nr:OmpA family protein [Thermoanaerobaculia bacterium]